MRIDFKHGHSAHCETGTAANLMTHHGIKISEPMVFGIGSGLFFGYLPFIKLNGLPLTTYRIGTGSILKSAARRLGFKIRWNKYRSPERAMDALNQLLSRGIPVGCRTGAYWLPYFPEAFRFHFNMHNIVVYGQENGDYLISDPVLPEPVKCPGSDLMKARFAQGALAPKGKMYHFEGVPEKVDFTAAIKKGIRGVCRSMLNTPGPLIGVKGVRFLARRLLKWPDKLGAKDTIRYLGQVIRMQEEIGTGGAGFRFIYAAFLQEAFSVTGDDRLQMCSEQMTQVGDLWRDFAVIAGRQCKKRSREPEPFKRMSEILNECAQRESDIHRNLLGIVKSLNSKTVSE